MVRFLKMLVFAAAAMALSGCYESQYLLLDTSAAAMPLASGTYSRSTDTRYISQQTDGFYGLGSSMHVQNDRLLLNAAAGLGNNVYYFAAQQGGGYWDYGLIVVSGSAIYVVRPDCALDGGIAVSEGATSSGSSGGSGSTCYFSDPGSLRRALDRYFRANSWGDPYYRQ